MMNAGYESQMGVRLMVFRQFLPYARKQLKLYIAGFIGSLFRFLIPLFVPLIMKYLLDDLLQNEAMPNVAKIRQISLIAAVMLVVFFLIRGPMEYVRQFFLHKANNNIIKALRTDTFRKIHALDAKYFADHKSGEVGTRFFDDIEKIRGYMTAVFSNIWMEMIVLVFVIGVMAALQFQLTLLAVGLVGFQFGLAHLLSKKLKLTTGQMMKYRSVLNGFIFEKIQGAFLSKLFATEKKDQEELDRHLSQYEHLTDRQAKINAVSLAAVNVLSDATPFIVVLVGSLSVIHGNLSLGALIAFFAYVDRMRSPVAALVQAFPAIAEGNVALKRIFEFFDTPVTVKEKERAVPLHGFQESITFRNVSFSYNPNHEVIKNMSFTFLAAAMTSSSAASGLASRIFSFTEVLYRKLSCVTIPI
jgi:subfamily B ATP-binding cassette protein MsbA